MTDNNPNNKQIQSSGNCFIEQIFQGPVEFKTTATLEPPDNLIPKEEQANVVDFLHILLSSVKDMAARPLFSCEKAYPPALRKKAFCREEIRRLKKKSENSLINKEAYIQELQKRISLIPDFSHNYDCLLDGK